MFGLEDVFILNVGRSGGHPERCLMDNREYSLKLSREVKAKDRWVAEPSLLPFLQEIKCISQPRVLNQYYYLHHLYLCLFLDPQQSV